MLALRNNMVFTEKLKKNTVIKYLFTSCISESKSVELKF